MFTIVRRIHLYTGAVLMAFLLMYFVTGFMLVHETWFPRGPTATTTRAVTFNYTPSDLPTADPQSAAEFVQRSLNLPGQPNPQQRPPARPNDPWRFNFAQPGVNESVVVTLAKPSATQSATQPVALTASVKITENRFGAAGVMNGLHRLRGFSGGWRYELWSVIFDASAVSLILFAISGVYLWFKLAKTKWPGVIALTIGMGFTIGTYAYLAIAR